MDDTKDGIGLPDGGAILACADGTSIAYHRLAGGGPGIVFLHGLNSDMNGVKALAIEESCRRRGQAFVRYDASGHGNSSGNFDEGSIGIWLDDCLKVIDTLTQGPQVLVGSSMGGWVALLAALARPRRVASLIGIAAAPDFTEDLMWAEFTEGERQELLETGFVTQPNAYDPASPWRIARLLVEEGRHHLLLRDAIQIRCPVRLIHGQKDQDVPWKTALTLADRLTSDDVEVLLIKDGDHRLSREQDIERIVALVEKMAG